MLIKSISKNRRNKLLNIKVFIKELKKGRGIFDEKILTV
jgi:hypothetical protein